MFNLGSSFSSSAEPLGQSWSLASELWQDAPSSWQTHKPSFEARPQKEAARRCRSSGPVASTLSSTALFLLHYWTLRGAVQY